MIELYAGIIGAATVGLLVGVIACALICAAFPLTEGEQ
jgi:hypothetical protein